MNYGLADETERFGVALRVFEPGGHGNFEVQREQIQQCLDSDPDALIVSAVDTEKLNVMLEKAHAKGIRIVDLINGVTLPHISAKSAGDYYDNGFEAGRYLVERNEHAESPVRVLWFPGPQGAGWVARGDAGFNEAIEGSPIEVPETGYGDTAKKAQGELSTAEQIWAVGSA